MLQFTSPSPLTEKIEISSTLNGTPNNQSLIHPFESPLTFSISNINTDNVISLTFSMTQNSEKKQIHIYELKMSPKFFSIPKDRKVRIPLSIPNENESEDKFSTYCEILITFSDPTKADKISIEKPISKTICSEYKAKKPRKKSLHKTRTKGSNFSGFSTISNPSSNLSLSKTLNKKNSFATNSKPHSRTNSKSPDRLRNSLLSPQTKLRMNFSKEKDRVGSYSCFTEPNYPPPKKAEDFLKIPAGTVYDNMSGACRRCDVLEKLVSALQRDIQSLQSQAESLLKKSNNEDNSPLELASKDVYKFPEFGLLFPTGIRQFDGVLKKKHSKFDSPSKTSFGGLRRRPSNTSDSPSPSPAHMLKKRNSVNFNCNFNRLLSDLSPSSTPNKRQSKASNCLSDLTISGSVNNNVNVKDQRAVKVERYEQEIDTLNLKVAAYEKKKRDYELAMEENMNLKDQMKTLIINKINLEEMYKSLLNKANKEIEKLTISADKKGNENHSLNEDILNLTNKNKELASEINFLKLKVKETETEANLQKVYKDFNENMSFSKANLPLAEQKKKIDRNEELSKAIEDMKNKVEGFRFENTKLSDENNRLTQRNRELENSLNNKIREIQEKANKIADLEANIAILKAENLNLKDINKQKEDIKINHNKLLNANISMKNDVNLINKTFKEQLDLLNDKNKLLEKEISNIKFNSIQYPIVINQKSKQIEDLIINLDKLKLELSDIKSKNQISEIEKVNSDVLKDALIRLFSYNAKLLDDSREVSDYLIMSSEKFKVANNYIKALIKTMTNKKVGLNEIKESLLEKPEDVKSEIKNERKVGYVGDKKDNIDLKLAETINNYPNYVKIRKKFTRLARGMYTYGNKKISILVQNNEISLLCDGKSLTFDEFIQKYGE